MKNKWLLLSLCAGYSFALCAQNPENDPVLMKVNGKSIKKSEFEYIYKKNNQQQTDSKSLDEYLELFKNYKLKVAEAEACGLDTTRSFRTELAGYRAQLVQPYLVDREMDDRLAKEAYDRGACHATHLYNAMPPFSHRAPGVIGAACDSPHVRAELICDGIHLHPAAVRTTFKMFGDDRLILISDSMMATGLNDGEYALGGQPVTVRGNLATLADGTIAGSATNLMDCVRTAVKKMDIPLGSAVKCAAVNSAKAVGIYDRYGSITPGKTANLVLLDKDLNLKTVYLRGISIAL